MNLYSDTELDSDIKCVKEIFSSCAVSCRDIEQNFSKINKTIADRTGFIFSQFSGLMRI